VRRRAYCPWLTAVGRLNQLRRGRRSGFHGASGPNLSRAGFGSLRAIVSKSLQGLAIGYFLLGRDEDAAMAGRRAVRSNPSMSVNHALLAAPVVRLGRMDEAKAASAQVLAQLPSFSISAFCAAVALPLAVADQFGEAWRKADLPQ
jgi:hypothetical protein